MKKEIVVTFYQSENESLNVLDITSKGEKIFGYDGNEIGSDSIHIFVSKKQVIDGCLNWFNEQGLKVHRIETSKDYYTRKNINKEGNFLVVK